MSKERLDRIDVTLGSLGGLGGVAMGVGIDWLMPVSPLAQVLAGTALAFLGFALAGIAILAVIIRQRPWAMLMAFMPWGLAFILVMGILGLMGQGVIAESRALSWAAIGLVAVGIPYSWWAHGATIRRARQADRS